MDSKCKYWMLLLTLLCVISLGFSYINYFRVKMFVLLLAHLYLCWMLCTIHWILMKMVLTIYSLAYGYLLAKSKHNLLQCQEGMVMFMESI